MQKAADRFGGDFQKVSLWLPETLCLSRKLASASWSLLALASIGGAAQGHHVIFPAKGAPPLPPPPPPQEMDC